MIDFIELKEIVEEAIDNPEYNILDLKIDKKKTLKNIFDIINKGAITIVIRDNNKVIALAIAVINNSLMFTNIKSINLIYLYSRAKGKKAVYVIKEIHKRIIENGRFNKVDVCLSSSILPTYSTFNKILIKEGWELKANTLMYKL